MNTTVFWRLAWKEYRQQRDLLVAIGLIALALLAIGLGWSWIENQPLSPDAAYHIALMMPVFYVLGCTAMLFAGEHERDTFAFLRALPLRSQDVFWPKAMMAIGSTLGLTAVLLILAAVLTQFRPLKTPADFDLLAHYFLIMAEVLVWTMLFSQLLKHPFWAIAAGGIAYLASWMVIALVGALIVNGFRLQTEIEFPVFVAVRCALVFLLAFVNVVLGTGWLQRGRVWTTSLAGPTVEEIAPAHGPATRKTMLSRLVWQSIRESGWIFAAIHGALALLSLLIILDRGSASVVWGCLPALVGSFTFFQDHWKQQYRFFSEHGVSPRMLWWSRILTSLAVCLPWLVVLIVAIATQTPYSAPSNAGLFGDPAIFQWPADLLVLAVICFAWGQWCSLVFRSGMIGLFVGVTMSLGLLFVLAILRALGIPDWLGIYLPAAVLLWASWYRAPDWLAERNSWRRWFAYAATLAVPFVLYLAGIAAHRAYEIPQIIDSSWYVAGPAGVNIPVGIATQHSAALAELQRPATSEELETARLYRELWMELGHLPPPNTGTAMMGSTPEGGSASAEPPGAAGAASSAMASAPQAAVVDKEWEEKLAKLVERFVEISRRPDADFFPVPFSQAAQVSEGPLDPVFERASVADARRLDDSKDHDQALERYLALIRFARHYQQRGDSQRIYTAVQFLGKVYEQLLSRAVSIEQSKESLLGLIKTLDSAPYDFSPDYELAWMRDYVWHRGLVELNPIAWEVLGTSAEVKTQQQLLAWLPWERTRAARWVDYQSVVNPFDQTARVQASRWRGNTLDAWIGSLHESRDSMDPVLQKRRAALELRLLLLAYKAEHGALPSSLEELEKAYPGQVPNDPATQQPWIYRPQGAAGGAELQRPFISPRTPNSGVKPNGIAEDNLMQFGEVFVIEPGESVE